MSSNACFRHDATRTRNGSWPSTTNKGDGKAVMACMSARYVVGPRPDIRGVFIEIARTSSNDPSSQPGSSRKATPIYEGLDSNVPNTRAMHENDDHSGPI